MKTTLILLVTCLLAGCETSDNPNSWVETNYVVTTKKGEQRTVEFSLGRDGNVKWRLGKLYEE